jgi:BirA family biotin operon repressor/biotin-[acetyl-CoA-carboxylase] ligase
MSLKINILKLLEQSRDKYISGEDMAFNFNVSRAAVNKAVNSLREEGHLIESVTKKGYRLLSESDVLSVEGILPYLRDDYRGNIYVFDTVESTNKTAKEIAMEGNEDGSVIVANGQTKGRGRQNRSFYSPKDTGVYMSYILRPQDDANIYNVVTVAACIAVCRAIYKLTGIECGIKCWKKLLVCLMVVVFIMLFTEGMQLSFSLTETYASMQTLTSRYIGMKGIGLFSTCSIWVDAFLSLLAIIWYTTLKT